MGAAAANPRPLGGLGTEGPVQMGSCEPRRGSAQERERLAWLCRGSRRESLISLKMLSEPKTTEETQLWCQASHGQRLWDLSLLKQTAFLSSNCYYFFTSQKKFKTEWNYYDTLCPLDRNKELKFRTVTV